MSEYGKFDDFCRDTGSARSTLPVCNLFLDSDARGGDGFGGCNLDGISLDDDRYLANLGSILVAFLAILTAIGLLVKANAKRAAVGRREIQLFLIGYAIISLCEIFSIGHFPLDDSTRRGFSAVHIAAVVATTWVLMLNGIVGYQLLDDGTPTSLALILTSAAALFIGTGYIALDHAFSFTSFWDDTLTSPNRSYSLYTLYFLVPLIFLVVFFALETILVLRILGEKRPMLYLISAAILFAIAQVFQFVISVHICNGSDGKLNGGFFQTLFTLLSVVMVFVFWSSITEDDWTTPSAGSTTYA